MAIRRVVRYLLGEYQIYWILAAPPKRVAAIPAVRIDIHEVSLESLTSANSPTIRDQVSYAGEEARVFVAEADGQPIGLCSYWYGERYRRRNFWPLRAGEAKLVQVIVDPLYRGRGIATALIDTSSALMRLAGFGRLYARVWHSNYPSLKAFKKADWRKVAFVVEISPFRFKLRCNMSLPGWPPRR
jgi:GNAT superfamily N-acetyltransferase